MWTFLMQQNATGSTGALYEMEGMSAGGNGVLVYFASKDCAVESKKAESNGGKVVKEKSPIGQHGFISLITDTEGNTVGNHSFS
jgi:uncharacterized protein